MTNNETKLTEFQQQLMDAAALWTLARHKALESDSHSGDPDWNKEWEDAESTKAAFRALVERAYEVKCPLCDKTDCDGCDG
jgi:hypothetical protein